MLQQIVCIIEHESCSRSICRVLKLILKRISDLSVVRKRNRGCQYRGLWMEGGLRARQQAGGLATKGRNGAEITLVLNVGKLRLILHHWRLALLPKPFRRNPDCCGRLIFGIHKLF